MATKDYTGDKPKAGTISLDLAFTQETMHGPVDIASLRIVELTQDEANQLRTDLDEALLKVLEDFFWN